MKNYRNAHGVKDSADCWRTIGGYRYDAWMSCPSEDRIASYRKAGVRCRRFGEELFVHQLDTDMARAVDHQIDDDTY